VETVDDGHLLPSLHTLLLIVIGNGLLENKFVLKDWYFTVAP
jgi:hypothetical protein